MGHFSVDVDVDSLRAAQRWLGTMADEAPREAKGIEGAPDDLAEWTGPAADKIKQEMRDLGAALTGFGPSFGDARDAVKAFADAAETFEDVTVPDYNRRYDQLNTDAETDMGAADRRAEDAPDGETPAGPTRGEIANGLRYALQGLQHEFEEEKKELKRKAQTLSSSLAGTSPIDVPESAVTSFTRGGGTAAEISTWPTVSPEASQSMRVDVTAEDIDAFDFSDMTEEERRQFNEDNPGVLDDLMSTDPPSAHLKDQVYHLGVPKVDGEDADSDTDAIDGAINDHYGQDRFAEGFETTEEFQRYAAWAEQYNVVEPFDEGQRDYLSRFNDYLWENREDVSRYIDETHLREVGYTGADGYQSSLVEQEFGEEDRQRLNALVADSYLMESNHRLGGGYDQLPEEMREAIEQRPETTWYGNTADYTKNDDFLEALGIIGHGTLAPGDGLAKEIALNAEASLRWADGIGNPVDYPKDELIRAFELTGRNEDASTDILTGDDMPEHFDPRQFLETVYNQPWSDDGAGAAALTDWIDEGLAEGDPRAQRAFDAWSANLTSTGDDGIFRTLMDGTGDESLGRMNPEIARSLMDAVQDPTIFDGLSRHPDDQEASHLDESARVRLFMLLGGDDDSAARLSATAQAHSADLLRQYDGLGGDQDASLEDYADRMARITSLTDAGIINAGEADDLSAQQAADRNMELFKIGAGMLAGLDPSGLAGGLVGTLSADNVQPGEPHLVDDWDQSGRHLTASNNINLARLLEANGTLPEGSVDDILENAQNPADAAGQIRTLLDRPGVNTLNDELQDLYPDGLNNWVANDEGSLEDLMDHGTPPGAG